MMPPSEPIVSVMQLGQKKAEYELDPSKVLFTYIYEYCTMEMRSPELLMDIVEGRKFIIYNDKQISLLQSMGKMAYIFDTILITHTLYIGGKVFKK
jgi:hypothetical protein